MIRKNVAFASRLDRRVTIQKPVETPDSMNEVNVTYQNILTGIPAYLNEKAASETEGESMNRVLASAEIEWQTRFVSQRAQANWRIVDELTGLKYDIIAPVMEIGRREGFTYKTQLVQ